ncbi:MAG: TerB family tellurite resistance protein [Alphaproteobacteria bacterium]|nr:TerB family tellurite resistance protein [Alphaproteobacteria bacterium]
MRDIIESVPDMNERAAQTIATAMRMVARADGEHPRELALIEEFEAGLSGEASGEFDLYAIDTPELKEAFLKSLILVAFADGKVSEAEGGTIRNFAQQLDLTEVDVSKAVGEVAVVLISQLAGVKLFREHVVALGQSMGLDEATIREVLTDGD